MALLTPIATEARSDFQKRAAAGVASQVIEMMTTANEAREVEASDPSQLENSPATDVSRSPRSLPESQPPGREAATAPRANVPEGEASRAARQSIERYVAETRDTPARSFIAEQIVDAFKARNVLQNIARRNGLSIDFLDDSNSVRAEIWSDGESPNHPVRSRSAFVATGFPDDKVLSAWFPFYRDSQDLPVVIYTGVEISAAGAWHAAGFRVRQIPVAKWNFPRTKSLEQAILSRVFPSAPSEDDN